MGSLTEHAKREMSLIGLNDDDATTMNGAMRRHLLRMIQVFADEGHSGFSASYAANALNKLLRHEPLSPLTGEEEEWTDLGGGTFQNNRCSRVFKDGERAYDIEGRVFRRPSGRCYTSGASCTTVEFPYTPATEIVDDCDGQEVSDDS